MPVLASRHGGHRREIFAQSLAEGHSLQEAYRMAGYKGRNSNSISATASRLSMVPEVAARITELQQVRSNAITQAAVARIIVTKDTVLTELDEARALAIHLDMPAAAITATMAKAKIMGLVIDRREIGEAGAFDNMTDDQLLDEASRRAQRLGLPAPMIIDAVIDNED